MSFRAAQWAWDNAQEPDDLEAYAIEGVINDNEEEIKADFLASDTFLESLDEIFNGNEQDRDDFLELDFICDYGLELAYAYSDHKKLDALMEDFAEDWARNYLDDFASL